MSHPKLDAAPTTHVREVLTASAVAAGALSSIPSVHAAGTDTLRVGLVGCGGRGTGALNDLVNGTPGVQIVALGDLFQEKVDRCYALLSKAAEGGGDVKATGKKAGRAQKKQADPGKLAAAWKVTPDRCFTGFDAYKAVIENVDLVILATAPGFRPIHFSAAVAAGKHVFMEKPVATCPTGVRMVIEAAKLAKEKGLGVVAGTQRRHTRSYIETVQRIHAGDIGDIVAAQCYWNGSGIWDRSRDFKPEWSELERQCYNWYHYAWICGDHIVEQHVHNLDVINWCFSKEGLAHPERCMGVGGRMVRVTPGNIWDYFAIEFEYPGGVKVQSYCRHWDGCPGRIGESVVGTRGTANPANSIQGEKPFRFEGGGASGQVQEHADLVASIRAGKPLNEGEQIATSTLMAIMGRMSAYTGKDVTWDFALNQSKLDYLKPDAKPGMCPVDPTPVPGQTPLV